VALIVQRERKQGLVRTFIALILSITGAVSALAADVIADRVDHLLAAFDRPRLSGMLSRRHPQRPLRLQEVLRLREPGTSRSAHATIGFLRWLSIEAIYGSEPRTGRGTGLSLPGR
jgi:hypothetical protein